VSDGIDVVKMSGAGNDFVVLDAAAAARVGPHLGDWVRRVCRHGVSVGADGVLVVEPAGAGRVRVRFLNPDGSEAFCGNGSRCAARFAQRRGFAGATMRLETAAGELSAEVRGARVRLSLPPPEDHGELALEACGERVTGRHVVAGAPHFVTFTDRPAHWPLERIGPVLRRHPRFDPGGTNVDVAGIEPDGRIAVRTWERGVERETLACGSGAVAVAFAAHRAGAERPLCIVPASGIPLEVDFSGPARAPHGAFLTGDARVVFEGRLPPEATEGFPPR
jgi:diaminopimelate epimerase